MSVASDTAACGLRKKRRTARMDGLHCAVALAMLGGIVIACSDEDAGSQARDGGRDASSQARDGGPDARASNADSGDDAHVSWPSDPIDLPSFEGRTFTEVADAAGLDYVHWDGSRGVGFTGAESLTAGAAAGDYDGDGDPDLAVSRKHAPAILYENQGDGTFRDVTDEVGMGSDMWTNGISWTDVEGDGDLDLYLTVLGGPHHFLYINQGDGTFVQDAAGHGLALEAEEDRTAMSACFGDYDRDGYLDVHVSGVFSDQSALMHNRGSAAPGVFENVTDSAGITYQDGEYFDYPVNYTPAFHDLDRDGWLDLILVNDFGATQLFWNEGDGTFDEGTRELGDEVPSDENGMGLAVGDYDLDGRLDWFVTSIYDPDPCDPNCVWGGHGNRLYRNVGDRRFDNATDATGAKRGGWGWGTSFFDYDNDGDLDLVMANGYENDRELGDIERFEGDPMRLWVNHGSQPMQERAEEAGINDRRPGKSLITFDYDGDGDLDVFVANTREPPVLYRNERGNERNWLRIRLRGRGPKTGGTNVYGLGARMSVRITPDSPPLVRERGGCGYLQQSVLPAHFGLGEATRVYQVRVWWPGSGREQILRGVEANQVLELVEPPAQ